MEDSSSIAALAKAVWQEHYTPLIGREQVEYMLGRFQSESVIAAAIQKDTVYHVASENGTLIGYLALKPEGEFLFLSKLYVRKEWRGLGVARRMLNIARETALSLGLPRVRLTVNKHNDGAIAAYKHMGFAICAEVVTDIGAGYVMDDYIMELPVGA